MERPTARLALYRKYRSQDFDQLVGQPHVTTSLTNALKSGRVSHAYLFAGPRGVGKTTAARIFARRINQLQADQAEGHLDIIEIDAASNRRIDEIRDLREKVHIAPTAAKYKVYIIDEAHMLTTEAFNALLKTLEEPPEHVIFILATTEPHKLPETIVSRTQRFSFLPVEEPLLTKHLKTIADAEEIKIDTDALELIAVASDGSVRDAIGLLDQVASLDKAQIDAASVSQLLGLVDVAGVTGLIKDLIEGNGPAVLKRLDEWAAHGVNTQHLVGQLINTLQHLLRTQMGVEAARDSGATELADQVTARELTAMIGALTALPPLSPHLAAAFEATLIKLCLSKSSAPSSVNSTRTVPAPATPPAKASQPGPKPKTKPPTQLDESLWAKTLMRIKTHHGSLYGLLRAAEPSIEKGTLILKFRFQFHRRRLEEGKNLAILQAALTGVYGHELPIKTDLKEGTTKESKSTPPAKADRAAVDSVLQILGGEVMGEEP